MLGPLSVLGWFCGGERDFVLQSTRLSGRCLGGIASCFGRHRAGAFHIRIGVGRLLAHHAFWPLVVAQALEGGVAQQAVAGPPREGDLGHEDGFNEMDSPARGDAGKGRGKRRLGLCEFCQFPGQFAQRGVGVTGAHPAPVDSVFPFAS